MQVGPFRNGGTPTTKIGYVNCNGQECLGHRGKSGIGCYQKAYKMKCLCCGYVYGANGFDVFQWKCQRCHPDAADGPEF